MFNFLEYVVSQFNIILGIFKHVLAYLPEIELNTNFLKDVTYHEFNSLTHQVKIVVFVEFVPALENTVDCLYILRRIAYLVVYYSRLIH